MERKAKQERRGKSAQIFMTDKQKKRVADKKAARRDRRQADLDLPPKPERDPDMYGFEHYLRQGRHLAALESFLEHRLSEMPGAIDLSKSGENTQIWFENLCIFRITVEIGS